MTVLCGSLMLLVPQLLAVQKILLSEGTSAVLRSE